MTVAEKKNTERETCLAELRELLPPGSIVHCILRHVSGSGMTRHIDIYTMGADGPNRISWDVARVLDMKVNVGRHDGIKVEGCGMDMAFSVVYNLSYALYPDGFRCIGTHHEERSRSCPSNDHANDRTRSLQTTPEMAPEDYPHHSDGGYALRYRWL